MKWTFVASQTNERFEREYKTLDEVEEAKKRFKSKYRWDFYYFTGDKRN